MNINQRKQIVIPNMVISPLISAEELGYKSSEEELSRILRTFNYENILVTLAKINLLFYRSQDLPADERILKKAFCSPVRLAAIDVSTNLRERFIFNRYATLRLLTESARLSDVNSTRTLDKVDARNALAKCYLHANGLFDKASPNSNSPLTMDERRKEFLPRLISSLEYVMHSSPAPQVKKLLVRSEALLAHLQAKSSDFDVNEIFTRATGLTLQDYQCLILGIFVFYWNFSPREICRQDWPDKSLFFSPKTSQALTPLYDKLLGHVSISIDELAVKAEETKSWPNEFRLWREYPLIKISDDRFICVDVGFLLEKLQSGVSWILRQYLRDSKDAGKFEHLWGNIFTDYAATIISRGISAQSLSSRETCIPNPKFDRKRETEVTDIAVYGSDTLILVECKASVLSAKAKFSGDFRNFRNGIAPNALRGIEQLANAIESLGTTGVKWIDISKVRKIYPILVFADHAFSSLGMNRFLDSEFHKARRRKTSQEHWEIMPLAVLTIADLENLEPYLRDKPFYAHLDEWIALFRDHYSESFNLYVSSLLRKNFRENSFMNREFERVLTDGWEYFAKRGLE